MIEQAADSDADIAHDRSPGRPRIAPAQGGDGAMVIVRPHHRCPCQVIQQQLAQVGIEVEILPYDSGAYWSLGVEKDGEMWKQLQLMFLRYTSAPDPSWATVWFTCEQVGVYNRERWCNEEFTRPHKAALKEADPTKRQPMYVRMQDLMEEPGAYIFVTHEATGALCRDTIVPANMPNNRAIMGQFRSA